MRLFDTHMHLDDEQFSGLQDEVIHRAIDAGVIGIVAVGTGLASSRNVIELADRFEIVHAAVGIQPNYVHEAQPDDWKQIEQLATHPSVVAIGETGLDHYWDWAPLDLQRDYFQRHLALAQQHQLPFIVHMREAKPGAEQKCGTCAQDLLEQMQRADAGAGIMHSYTGDEEMAASFLKRGMWISFAGMVTYKKSDQLRAVAKTIPADRILIETDAPYLSPHPHRGQRPNEPALVSWIARCLAEVHDETPEAFAERTTTNAIELFALA